MIIGDAFLVYFPYFERIVGNPPQRNNRRIVESRVFFGVRSQDNNRSVFFGVRPQTITGKARQEIYSLQSLQGWSLSLKSALALVAKRGHDTTRHRMKVALWDHHAAGMSVCLWIPSYQLLNAWTSLYETSYAYHGIWAHLNGVLYKSVPSVCVPVCVSACRC
jgi:hypothetical protein